MPHSFVAVFRRLHLPSGPILLAAGGLAWLACAEGFRNPPPGAFSLGRAGGRIAQIDDASAVTQNPANLVDLTNREVAVEPMLIYIGVDYQSPTGARTHTIDPWKLLPSFYASLPLKENRLEAGFGVTSPYGLSNEWEPGGAFHYTAPHFVELKTINASPAIACRLVDRLQIGVGLDVMWSQLTLKQFYPWGILPGSLGAADGELKAKGDGYGYGANLGLTWEPFAGQRLAVTYRSPVTVDFNGHFQVSGVPAAYAAFGPRSDFGSRIVFPTIVAGGYGVELGHGVRLEADVEWLQFSNFDQLPLNITRPPPGLPPSVAENWNDTFTAGLGGDWHFLPAWWLRFSYQFYESPIPDLTFSPTIPDSNQNVITLGLGYRHGRHTFEASYGLVLYDPRHINNPAPNATFNGAYDFNVHLISVAYHFAF